MSAAGTAHADISRNAGGSSVQGVGSRSERRSAWLVIALVAAAGVAAMFFRWFEVQHKLSWTRMEDWGHAYMIPLISAWLLWQNRELLASAPKSVFVPGLIPFLFGCVAYIYLVIGFPNHMGQGISLIITLYGMLLLVFGPSVARIAFLPIAFLGFAVTISEMIMIEVTFQLQQLASIGSWVMLGVIGSIAGFDVDLQGTTLTLLVSRGGDIREFPLNVAEACSGMRMVVAFAALSGAVALISCREWWQRIATVLLAVPVALLMNMVRVTVLGLLTLFDPDLAAGQAHTVIGTILLIPSLLLFLGIVWALKRVVREPAGDAAYSDETVAQTTDRDAEVWSSGRSRRITAVGAAGVLLLSAAGFTGVLAGGGINLEKTPIHPPGQRQLGAIPAETEHWQRVGTDHVESADVVKTLGTENYLTRVYRRKEPLGESGKTPQLQFHAAYYTGMIDAVPHVPERCFIGGGLQKAGAMQVEPLPMKTASWLPDSSVPEKLTGEGDAIYTVRTSTRYSDADPPGKRVRLPRGVTPDQPIRITVSEFAMPGGEKLFAGYFFIANGGTVPRAEGVRTLAFDLRSDYAYYLKVQFTSGAVSSSEELARQAGDLLEDLLPEIMRCVPDWIEVELGRYPPERDDEKSEAENERA